VRHFSRPSFLSIYITPELVRPFGVAELGVRLLLMNPQFRNVDLEIVAPVEPKRMISDLGRAIVVLYSEPLEEGHFVAIETSIEYSSAEEAIMEFKSLLSRLSPEGLLEWSTAIKKEFNFGYDCQLPSGKHEIQIPASVITALAEFNASIGFTSYHNTAEQDAAANP